MPGSTTGIVHTFGRGGIPIIQCLELTDNDDDDVAENWHKKGGEKSTEKRNETGN